MKKEREPKVFVNEKDIVNLDVPTEKECNSKVRVNEKDIIELDVPNEQMEDFKDMDVLEYMKTYGTVFELIQL